MKPIIFSDHKVGTCKICGSDLEYYDFDNSIHCDLCDYVKVEAM